MIRNKIVKKILSASLLALLPLMAACNDSFIFDPEGDCSVKVQFLFTKNRQALQSKDGIGPDAFVGTVETVHLFVLDSESGELVFEKTEDASNLVDGFIMPTGLGTGTYTFIAWCGLNSNDENNAFKLNHKYASRAEGDHCRIKTEADGNPVRHEKFEDLYHGVTRNVTITGDNIDRPVKVELTKNTNSISVWIQHPEATFEDGDYTVSYEDANGTMHFDDNSLISEDETLTYSPHTTSILTSTSEYNGDQVEAGALIAHLSVARLMASHKETARLVVRDKEGSEVFAIPFLKYLLEMQTFTSTRSAEKTEQWYLDCEDTYNCSFYIIGDQGEWTANRIIINNWVKVPDQDETL